MVEVKLHDIGEGMTEGTIVSYFAREGDEVKRDQPIIELQTEKMVTELSAPVAGTISKIHIEEGKTIPVGTTILEIQTSNSVKNESENKTEAKQETVSGPKRIKAAPFTRKVARELGVDIDAITGTGKDGRITVKDVESFSKGGIQTEEKQIPYYNLIEKTNNYEGKMEKDKITVIMIIKGKDIEESITVI